MGTGTPGQEYILRGGNGVKHLSPCHSLVSIHPSVYQSDRLSVTFVDHVKTNKHIFEIFSLSGSHTIPVFFHTKRGNDIPTETLLYVCVLTVALKKFYLDNNNSP